MIRKLFTVVIIIFFALLIFPESAFALKTGLGDIPGDEKNLNPSDLGNKILQIALGAAGGVAFLLIIYGGFKLAFSRGDPQAIQDARDVITSAIVGLVIIVMAVFLLRLIGIDILGLPI